MLDGVRRWFRRARAGRAEEVVRAGDHTLYVEVLHAGTRSEGRIGRLFHDGVEVIGRSVGEVVDAGRVRFVFRGDERPHLWSVSGWTIDD